MRIVVTGAAGFIGAQIAAQARDRGHEVVAIDNYLAQAHGSSAMAAEDVIVRDMRHDRLDDLLEGADAVCHQAAMVGNGVDAQDFPLYAAHNDLGTAELLAAMARVGTSQLVLASSMVVYGDGRYTCSEHGDVPPAAREDHDLSRGHFEPRCPICSGDIRWHRIDEDAPFLPRTAYAASKVAAEHYAQAWCIMQGGRAVALRYHNVYGPGMPRDTPYSGVAAIFSSALANGHAPRVFEDGCQTRDFVHVHDVAHANVLALESLPEHQPGLTAYNISSGHPFTIGQMAEVLADAAGGQKPVVTGDYRVFDVRHVVASPQRAAERLGFRATIAPEDGLAQLAGAKLRDAAGR